MNDENMDVPVNKDYIKDDSGKYVDDPFKDGAGIHSPDDRTDVRKAYNWRL